MSLSSALKEEFSARPSGVYSCAPFKRDGFLKETGATVARARANAIAALFTEPGIFLYKNDLIAGSIRPLFVEENDDYRAAEDVCARFGRRGFWQNADHFAPDYRACVTLGIPGIRAKIAASRQKHASDAKKTAYLDEMALVWEAFATRVRMTAEKAAALRGTEGYDDGRLAFIENNCRALLAHAPATFAEGLQLVWLVHVAFVMEGRYAMALSRMDQYLYPLYRADVAAGRTDDARVTELLENVFMKIYEHHAYRGTDDVVNICVGGQSPDGRSDVNPLSYCVLRAVGNCNVPGPNLSARIASVTPDDFLDECLKVIGTGLGYPALMNDDVNLAALAKYGYAKEDLYDYSMVGCIENHITGRQPAWSDGRFDTPRYLEMVFNRGKGIKMEYARGIDQGDLSDVADMAHFMRLYEDQLRLAAKDYVDGFNRGNRMENEENFTSPFLSLFCADCIDRGMDINLGGARYPSVHGAAVMGVGTVCDSLAAIEKTVFVDHTATLAEIGDAMRANFEGHEDLRRLLLAAPKYGNNDDFVDKYAVWFVKFLSAEFRQYHTNDGGGFYIAMAANTSNIYAGQQIAATPDGRLAGEPLSDAASPTYGRDTNGATFTVASLTKADYSDVACGTVVNQKFSPSMFSDEKRDRLRALIRVYFARGGQEMQINATSREVLKDAMAHPENYPTMVVRVSGFSAIYITLPREVQVDILNRTQQE